MGQLVYTFVEEQQAAGIYTVDWRGIDAAGRSVPSGVYIVRLQAGSFSQARKLALVK